MAKDLEKGSDSDDYHGPRRGEMEHLKTPMSAGQYLGTRLTTLTPPMMKVSNPLALMRTLNARQWSFFLVSFWAWTWDSFDFFTISMTITELAEQFNKTKADITWGITLVLMFRPVGSIAFGIVGDRYGRKWPFIVNLLLFSLIELGTSFCNTYSEFLACRALFGIAMGGLYGNAASTALDDCPNEARGLMSGLLQQGYAFGYLLCSAFSRALVGTTPHGWRPLFWFDACVPLLIITWRMLLPETNAYLMQRKARQEQAGTSSSESKAFLQEGKAVLRQDWLLLVYLVLFMAGFNFMAHGSQDLYPTMLKSQLEFDANMVTITQIVANLGAILGGTVVGCSSQIFGRRLSIIACCLGGAALLYPYTFVSSNSIIAAAFFEQLFVQGAWGVVPVHLIELSPPAFRAFIVGTSYQLGNLISSASSTIEATLGEKFPLPDGADGEHRYDYGKVICIFMACVYAYLLLLTFLGPEKMNAGSEPESSDSEFEHLKIPHDGIHKADV
ncbi:hypothetical protein MKZ38_005714 [Zalerion maritima]|uniref:Major facilitator superfamily (MFS) profile domain-containing protein n=1 Tax=Zalerion maritima TaxID=339359 RepID=A0AAD5WQ67_9PEZI|nr:hypothetical protein MKZ38_005714 [Zalerion maritima]